MNFATSYAIFFLCLKFERLDKSNKEREKTKIIVLSQAKQGSA